MGASHEMFAVVKAVESGSFSTAARELGLTPSALSKLVTRLENRLGARLLHRSTRSLRLTPEGEVYFQRAREILAAIEEAETEVMQSSSQPRGLLRVHSGSTFGRYRLTPLVPRFLQQYPDVQLALTISDDPQSAEQADLSIRLGALDDSSRVARRLGVVSRVICAAPSYLQRFGTPETPDDLMRHNCLWLSSQPALRRWPFDTEEGLRITLIDGTLSANNAETLVQLAIAGVGIVRLVDLLVQEAIQAGQLVPILTRWHHDEPVPLYAIFPSARNLSPKVRAMVDFLVEACTSGTPSNHAAGKPDVG